MLSKISEFLTINAIPFVKLVLFSIVKVNTMLIVIVGVSVVVDVNAAACLRMVKVGICYILHSYSRSSGSDVHSSSSILFHKKSVTFITFLPENTVANSSVVKNKFQKYEI